MSWDVNKLVVREYDYMEGNTATNPSRKSTVAKPRRKKEELQRAKRNKNKNLKNKKKSDRKYVLTIAIVILGFGCMTISGDGRVYKMQKQVSDLNSQISKTQEENEALKVKLLKFSSLSNIQEGAQSKLEMVVPNKDEVVKIDFSENYFKDIDTDNAENNKEQKNLFSKLLGLIK